MAEPEQIDVGRVIQRVGAARTILVTPHARADGDAIGSCVGLTRILAGLGKSASAVLHEAVPERYGFMVGSTPILIWDAATATGLLASHDLLIVVDTCSANQLGVLPTAISTAKTSGAKIATVAIDHHRTRDAVVTEALVDDKAAACGQIIVSLCEEAGWAIDRQTAELLYVALATDTGWFRFSNSTEACYLAAARLVELGASPNKLYEQLYLNEPVARLRLVGVVLSECRLFANDQLAVSVLSQEHFRRCGATSEMTEDLINEPMRIGSVIASVLIVEPPDAGPIRVSLRSKRDVDVASIARELGGGGHERAAGVRIAGTLAEVTERVTQVMKQNMPVN